MPDRGFLFFYDVGLQAAAAHGVSPAAEFLLALGALTIHRSGLEAAFFQPALHLVFREADIRFKYRFRFACHAILGQDHNLN
jgi:hypothetical protein